MPFFLVSGLLLVLAFLAFAHHYSSSAARRMTHRAFLSEMALAGCKSAIDEALTNFVTHVNVNDQVDKENARLYAEFRALKDADVLTYRYTPSKIAPPPGITLAVRPVDLAVQITDRGENSDQAPGPAAGPGARLGSAPGLGPGSGPAGTSGLPAVPGTAPTAAGAPAAGGASAGGGATAPGGSSAPGGASAGSGAAGSTPSGLAGQGLSPAAASRTTRAGSDPGGDGNVASIPGGAPTDVSQLSEDQLAKARTAIREFLATGACTVHLDFTLQTKQRGFLAASTQVTASSPLMSVTRRLEVRRLITLDQFRNAVLQAAGVNVRLSSLDAVSNGQSAQLSQRLSQNVIADTGAQDTSSAATVPTSGVPLLVHISPFDIVHLTDRDSTPALAPGLRPLPSAPPPDAVPERIFRAPSRDLE